MEEDIKVLEEILKVRKEQKEIIESVGGYCGNCNPDIKALINAIQVGDYVRTNAGVISRLIRIERDDIDTSLKWYILEGERYINKPYIIDYSKNIVDLLRQGDILKIDVGFAYVLFYISTVTKDRFIDGAAELKRSDIGDFIIKSGPFTGCEFTLVTKEQFASVEYRLEA